MSPHPSRAAHRAAVDQAPLVVEFRTRVTVTTAVGLVSFFTNMSESERDAYWSAPLGEYQYAAEWERPLMYVSKASRPEVVEMFDDAAISTIEDDDDPERVTRRDGRRPAHENRHWSREDFEALCAAVPWLKRPDAPHPWEPGPEDVPLFA